MDILFNYTKLVIRKESYFDYVSGIKGGYVFAPFLHNADSTKLKEVLEKSNVIDAMYFVTASFSEDGSAYFPSRANTYLLARFQDPQSTMIDIEKYKQDKPTFVFAKNDEFFERLSDEKLNLVSVYYLDYGHSDNDLSTLALIVAKRSRVKRVEWGHLYLASTEMPKFTFPYSDNLVVMEVSSDNTHQSDNKYCEKTRKEVARKGIQLTNLLNLSVIEKIK